MEVFVAVATIKNSIQIDSNVEFDVDGDSNASSADNWIYNRDSWERKIKISLLII